MKKYYVISHRYVGPNIDQNMNKDTVGVFTTPACGNMSRQPIVAGWCGTTNGWSEHAHGEYNSLSEATAFIISKFDVRDINDQETMLVREEEAVELFLIGRYTKMSKEATGEWLYHEFRNSLTIETTDEEIQKLVKVWMAEVNRDGYEFHPDAESMAIKFRDEIF